MKRFDNEQTQSLQNVLPVVIKKMVYRKNLVLVVFIPTEFQIHLLCVCTESVQIGSFLWSIFSCIYCLKGCNVIKKRPQHSEYGKIRTRKNSVFEHLSRNGVKDSLEWQLKISITITKKSRSSFFSISLLHNWGNMLEWRYVALM